MASSVRMRVGRLAAASCLLAALVACGGGSLPPGVARASGSAPTIERTTLGGTALPDLRGRVLVVTFWNPYCVPCRVEAPVLERAAHRFASKGVVVVGVHYTGQQWPASVPDALSFVRAAHLTYPVVGDPGSGLARGFGIQGIPTTVVVDAGGRMRFRVLGPVKPAVLDDLVRRALSTT